MSQEVFRIVHACCISPVISIKVLARTRRRAGGLQITKVYARGGAVDSDMPAQRIQTFTRVCDH